MSHGHNTRARRSPEYTAWNFMIGRCYRPRNHRYAWYGGRGIRVCDRWRTSFEAFLADVGPRPTPRHSLDRIDNDGDYEPGNVRWATSFEQSRNRRNVKLYTHDGETLTLSEWADRVGLPYSTLKQRVSRLGWSLARALKEARYARAFR